MIRKLFIGVIILLLSIPVMAQDNGLNVMTFNIRLNTASDSLNAWPLRRNHAASQILFHRVELLGVQEALPDQMQDLRERLPRYRSLGVGREDGKNKGEFSAIFYDTSRLEVLQSASFWLSETPELPGSKSWDAAITRMVTWAHFRDRKTRKDFYAFNTHFDHIGKIARRNSAQLLLTKIVAIAGKKPVIVTGDFNAKPSDEPIQVLLDPANANRLTDSKALSETPHYGPEGSFTAFGPRELGDQPIDHIFLKGKFRVLAHANLSETWQGRFSSDHFPVWTRLILP